MSSNVRTSTEGVRDSPGEVRGGTEGVQASTTIPNAPTNAQTRDQTVYTMIRGYTNYRPEPWVTIDNEESEIDFQQFVYHPIVRDRSVGYILQLRLGKRITATVRFNEYFNTVEAIRFLIGEFEINSPSCRRTESLQYRITQCEVCPYNAEEDPMKLRTTWRVAPPDLRESLQLTPGE